MHKSTSFAVMYLRFQWFAAYAKKFHEFSEQASISKTETTLMKTDRAVRMKGGGRPPA